MDFINNSIVIYAIVALAAVANFIKFPIKVLNIIKRCMGAAWIFLGVLAEYVLVDQGIKKINESSGEEGTQTIVQWAIIIIIFTIVMIGFIIHGFYSLKGEYSEKE